VKRLLVVLLICLTTSAYAEDKRLAWGVMGMMGGPPAAGGPDYSGIVLFWRGEALQMGAGDTYGTASLWTDETAAVINTDAAYTGTNGLDCPTSSDYITLANNGEYITSSSAGRIGFMMRITTWADTTGMIACGNSTNSIAAYGDTTDGEIVFNYKGNLDPTPCTTTGAAINDGQWHFIELMWNQATPSIKIYVDNVERCTSSAAMTAMSAAPPGNIVFGEQNGVASDTHFDTLIISTDSAVSLYGLRNATSAP